MGAIKRNTSYEEACKELLEDCSLSPEGLPIIDLLPMKDRKSIIAHYKLMAIIRVLNEGWEPEWSNLGQEKFYNWYVPGIGFICSSTVDEKSILAPGIGSGLYFKSRESAKYAIENFENLYREYLIIY